VGLADHLDGGDDLALVIPLLALALGAVAIEKHITWDRAERGEDFESALDPARFKTFVRYVRAAETALGEPIPAAQLRAALKYRQVSRKRVVASGDLAAGVILEPRHLACKRSDAGALPDERPSLLGRRTRVTIAADGPITWDQLE
jgi:sialic acid synthase SpsE